MGQTAQDSSESPSKMHDLAFKSDDHRFGLTVPRNHWLELSNLCMTAGEMETGGILVGYYTREHDCAIVAEVSGPPADTTAGKTWLQRGVAALQSWLHELWTRRTHFYLGEWHYHPNGRANPSPTDISEMTRIARSARFRCPEPILLVVSGESGRFTPGAFVFLRNGDSVELRLKQTVPTASRAAKRHRLRG